MKKGMKVSLTIFVSGIALLIVFFLFKAMVLTITRNWYFLTFVHPSDIDMAKYGQTHNLKVVEVNDDYLLIKTRDHRVFYRNEDIEEVCEFSFRETYSSKHELSYTLHDQRCNPLRRSYMNHHPVMAWLMTNEWR